MPERLVPLSEMLSQDHFGSVWRKSWYLIFWIAVGATIAAVRTISDRSGNSGLYSFQ